MREEELEIMSDRSKHPIDKLSPLVMIWPTHTAAHTSVQCLKHEQLKNFHSPIYVRNTLDTFNFRLEDVQEKLKHLSIYKSTGPDLLHPRVLWTLEDMLCGPLNHISNKSAETGIIPADWKSANVTAIHKKGNRQEPGNYRTIIFTSVVCKTMERLVKGKLITHLEGNNLTPNMASETSAAA